MKLFIFIFSVLFTTLTFVKCHEYTAVIKNVHKYVHNNTRKTSKQMLHSQNHKLSSQCPTIKSRLAEAEEYFENCASHIDDSLTLCERAKPIFLNCTSKIVEVIDNCVPVKSKGIIYLIYESIYSGVNHLCHETGESLFEIFNNCVWNDLKNKTSVLTECEERIANMARKYRYEITTNELCRDMHRFRNCVQERVNHTCKNNITRQSFIGLYDAMLKPCHKHHQQ